MKKLAAILCLSALTTGAFAQGLVQFFPTASTLSSINVGGTATATSGAAGSYFYGLLTASAPAGPFTFSGTYATNLSVAGYFGSPGGRAVAGWGLGATMSYEVAFWSVSLGATWKPAWLQANGSPQPAGSAVWGGSGYFGLSAVATGISGGAGTPASPPLALFGGASGIQSGFVGQPVGVPEPSSMALAGLGAAALLIFRRRK